jgi:sarcosine oxidase subunit delta
MLLIPCPYCGPRPELEFSYGGEAHIARAANQDTLTDSELERFLYLRTNTRGLHAERWRHTHGCARFFNAVRDTVTDRFHATYKVGEPPHSDLSLP